MAGRGITASGALLASFMTLFYHENISLLERMGRSDSAAKSASKCVTLFGLFLPPNVDYFPGGREFSLFQLTKRALFDASEISFQQR